MSERMNRVRMQRRLLNNGGEGYADPDRPNRGWIRVLTELELRLALIEIAKSRNVSLSAVVREALWAYIRTGRMDD